MNAREKGQATTSGEAYTDVIIRLRDEARKREALLAEAREALRGILTGQLHGNIDPDAERFVVAHAVLAKLEAREGRR